MLFVGFLYSLFQGLRTDKVSTIQIVLPVLLEKVCELSVLRKKYNSLDISGHDVRGFVLTFQIVNNPSVQKVSKLRLFSDKALKDISALYRWKGPQRWRKDSGKKKPGEEGDANDTTEEVLQIYTSCLFQFQTQETPMWEQFAKALGILQASASAEDQDLVRDMCHEFLLALCCNFKGGINFFDRTYGTSGKYVFCSSFSTTMNKGPIVQANFPFCHLM